MVWCESSESCLTFMWSSKNILAISGSSTTSFQGAPGRREGFWSVSKTEISFFGRWTLIKDHDKTDSAKVVSLKTNSRGKMKSQNGNVVNNIHVMLKRVHYLRTRLCLSGAMGCWASVGLSSLRACRQNWKILMRSVSSNCFLALKCVSQGRPTSEDLTVVAYSCIIALKMLHPIICIWK